MAALTFYLPTVIFISLVGGFLPLLRELSQKALALLLSFSAGVLLGAVFFHMLPETGRVLSDNMGWPVLTGFLLIFAMERPKPVAVRYSLNLFSVCGSLSASL